MPDDKSLASPASRPSSHHQVSISDWGQRLAERLVAGGRLLVVGNGGSAAQAQHLAAELVGRFDSERGPLSALALTADSATLTALANDYGYQHVFARQVRAHGRNGDVLLVLSTSGSSLNVLHAVAAAHECGMSAWALTGPAPNLVAAACDEYIAMDETTTAGVQEKHLVAVHSLCRALDRAVAELWNGNDRAVYPRVAEDLSVEQAIRLQRRNGAVTLAVIGDALLDIDLEGTVERVSPEAPVPVVANPVRRPRPGGAGMVALLAARDGNTVTLVTALGDDDEASEIRAMLTTAGVRVISMPFKGRTPVKTRVRARGQTLLRFDRDSVHALPGDLPPESRAAVLDADVVLVADYGYGVAAASCIRSLLDDLAGHTPIVWDPHVRGPEPVPGVSVVKLNDTEASHICGVDGAEHDSGMAAAVRCGRLLRHRWSAGHLVVTRGQQGAILVSDDSAPPLVVSTHPVPGADVCGAGDRFGVALAAELARGSLPSQAVAMAVQVATQYVGDNRGEPPAATTYSGVDAELLADRTRRAGGRVVATAGCFDLLHRGHVAMLQHARRLGDCLIVCLNSDSSVRRLKGSSRPLVAEADRAGVLLALSAVSAVLIFEEDTPSEVLACIRPDVYVKGGDYSVERIPERAVVERHGGQVAIVPYLDGRSTSMLVTMAQSQAVAPGSGTAGRRQ